MDEQILQGYCRVIDGSRRVFVEDGEADCSYPDCPYAKDCPVTAPLRRADGDGSAQRRS